MSGDPCSNPAFAGLQLGRSVLHPGGMDREVVIDTRQLVCEGIDSGLIADRRRTKAISARTLPTGGGEVCIELGSTVDQRDSDRSAGRSEVAEFIRARWRRGGGSRWGGHNGDGRRGVAAFRGRNRGATSSPGTAKMSVSPPLSSWLGGAG